MKFFLIFLFSTCLISCVRKEGKELAEEESRTFPLKKEQPTLVKFIIINEQPFKKELLVNGKLEAIKRANIKFVADGIIKNIFIREGEKVNNGTKLAVLDNSQQQRNIIQNELRYKQAVLDYEDQILRLGFTLKDTLKLDPNTKNIAMLRSGLSNAKIELQRLKSDLGNMILTAPFAGKIANLKGRNYVSSSSSEYFCTLIDDNELMVDFLVLEQELPFIRQSKLVYISPFDSENIKYKGTIVSINPSVDKSGMVSVKACVKNIDGRLIDGMNVKIIVSQDITNQLTVPKSAVLDRQGKKVVFTINGDKAHWNYVEIGNENSSQYSIVSGLKLGDKVIYDGNFNLAHDKKIKVE